MREFKRVVSEKRNTRKMLLLLAPRVKRRWYGYLNSRHYLERMTASPFIHSDVEKEALKKCYGSDSQDGEKSALRAIKNRIRRANPRVVRCQYCCGVCEATTWDHYLPKEIFPEFSVYPPNLVPCCSDCNSRRDPWLYERHRGNRRSTIHFYYDRFDPSWELIKVTFEFDQSGAPEPEFQLVTGVRSKTPFGRLFARHCRKLGLFARLRRASVTWMANIERDIAKWFSRGYDVPQVAFELDQIARARTFDHGANYIEAVLYRAVAKATDVVDYFMKLAQPKPSRHAARGRKS